MSVLTPKKSSAFVMKPDSTIAECVHAMKEHGFGAVLIASPESPGIAGIFTERDLLHWAEDIERGVAWHKPVFLLMSKPVVTITIEELADAPRIMVEKGIRHLPVLHTDPDTGQTIVSMISMRDVLKSFAQSKRFTRTDLERPIRVGMIAKSKGVRQLLRRICAERGNSSIEELRAEATIAAQTETLEKLDYLIFDLDHFDSALWAERVKELNHRPHPPEVLLIYSPDLHTEPELEVLTKLGLSGRFSAYMKPLNLYTIIDRLI